MAFSIPAATLLVSLIFVRYTQLLPTWPTLLLHLLLRLVGSIYHDRISVGVGPLWELSVGPVGPVGREILLWHREWTVDCSSDWIHQSRHSPRRAQEFAFKAFFYVIHRYGIRLGEVLQWGLFIIYNVTSNYIPVVEFTAVMWIVLITNERTSLYRVSHKSSAIFRK